MKLGRAYRCDLCQAVFEGVPVVVVYLHRDPLTFHSFDCLVAWGMNQAIETGEWNREVAKDFAEIGTDVSGPQRVPLESDDGGILDGGSAPERQIVALAGRPGGRWAGDASPEKPEPILVLWDGNDVVVKIEPEHPRAVYPDVIVTAGPSPEVPRGNSDG